MTIRNKKISQVRFDATNLNAPTVNRALDNIINTVNPFIDEVAAQVNALETNAGTGTGQITINPENAASVTNSTFNLYGTNGITFGSNGINSITISQATSSNLTLNVSGASTLTGSQFNITGANGVTFSTPNSSTLVISGSTGGSLTINAQTGSITANPINIIGAGCCIHTETSGSDTLVISSSCLCEIYGSTNIDVVIPQTTVISGTNPNTVLLAHLDSTLTISPGVTAIDYGQVGAEHPYPAVAWQGFSSTLDTSIKKFGSGSARTNGDSNGPVSIYLAGLTSSLGADYLENVYGTLGDFTYECWIYPYVTTGYGFQNLMGIGKSYTSNVGFGLYMYLGQLAWCDPANPAGVGTGYTFTNPNQWYALAVCRKGNVTRVYVDGVLVYTVTGANFGTDLNYCIVGQSPYGYYLHVLQGNMDEIRYSNVAYYTGSTYQTQSAEFPSFSGTATTYVDYCARQISLTGAICSNAVITSSYPCPQYLNTPFTGATDAYVKVKNQITTKDIWITPADQIDAVGKDRQNSIGLRGIDADQAVFYSWDGGDVKLLGGTSRIGHAGNSKGGNIDVRGGEGGGGTSGIDGGPGGDVIINGGIGGGPGVGANFGASGSILIGNNSNIIQIGNNAKNNANQFTTTTTVSGNFIAPILGDVSGNTNVTKVVGLQGNPVRSGSIALGAPLIYGSEGWYGQYISGSDPTTISLLHFDGTNGSTVFPDTGYYSGSAQQINWQQFNGGAISTAQYQFGSASLELQLANAEYVTSSQTGLFQFIGNSAGANVPNGDYTIELWFYLNAYGPANGNTLFHLRNPTIAYPQSFQGIHAWVTNGGALNVDNGVAGFFSYPSLVTTGSWHNFVMVRQGTAYRFYYDGVAMGGGTINGLDCGPYLGTSTIQIGRYGNGGVISEWDGFIDEFRISNVARYPAGNIPATMVTQSAEWANAYPQVITQYGDISGSYAGFTVTGIQGIPVSGGVPNNGDILVYDSGSNIWKHNNTRFYGNYYDTTTQTASATPNTALPMLLNSTISQYGISVVSGSRITMANAGTYNIQYSAQFDKTDAGSDDVDIWLSQTGSNVPYSNTQVTLQGNNTKYVGAWNWLVNAAAGDYYEIMWYSADTNLRILAQGTQSSPARPEIPSVIVTVSQV